ncbi:MAG: sugar phosphate isomerase/epimerase [Lentisphaerae bacterium]|jgi:3-dehydroshikimate dehydratase|nr:sugar phosphate isomerase/epimerase [Lentisphaerota bacterium]MBT4814927.1 sugar phosphate isomerase/epimerase [Lentisphaerota bacterium]MBT5605821.1 sugar phosphate isomerase/epimerase [Lentisphaerota bacterium]MBT7055624.1 sugar phosphate isomerase/epimerase [Lentisphaerota bacterium]MBT7846676.1 sugar phosphate isomerase/epimerase [Lentisphaerota bacterium]
MQVIMHSYTFRTYSLDEAFRSAKRFGWDGVELQPCHFSRPEIETELPAAIALGQSYGVPIACVDIGGDVICDDTSAAEATVAQIERELEICAANGITLVNGGVGALRGDDPDYGANGSVLATDIHYARAADAYRHLGAVAARLGITIVFEIHMFALHDTIASTARLLDEIGVDNVKANPDPGNMFSTSTAERNPDALDQLAGRIGYFHFKNCQALPGKQWNYSVLLADGHIDFYKWTDKLVKLGFEGPVCVEYCGVGDPHVAAEQDRLYLDKILSWVKH